MSDSNQERRIRILRGISKNKIKIPDSLLMNKNIIYLGKVWII